MNKKSSFLQVLIIIGLMVGLIQSVAYAEEKVSATVKILEPVSLGTVTLRQGVTANVNNLLLLPSTTSQMVGLTLTIHNNSNSELNFIDYWVRLYTKSGSQLNIKMLDPTISRIPSKTTVDINFIGTVGNEIKVSELLVKVVMWDFSVSSKTKVLKELAVPSRYNPVTPADEGRIITTGDIKTSFYIEQATIGKSDKYYRPEIKLKIKNDGKRTIELPDYQLFILTKNNLMYPLSVKNLKGTALDPLTENEFQLTASIPLAVDEEGWKLVVINSANDGKDKQPLGMFSLPTAQIDSGNEKGKYYTFTNADGIYNIKLDSVNRLPIEEDDLIISTLTIANKTNKTLALPALSGKYLFNESVEKSVVSSNNDKQIALQPGTTSTLQLISRVPYTFEINEIKLTIQQKGTSDGGESENSDLVEFIYNGKFDAIPQVASTTGFKISDIGYRADVTIRNQMLFSGETADILVAQLMITNQEKRLTNVQKFGGYFEKSDGTIYPASFENVTEKLAPAGKAIVFVSTTIPKDTDTKDIRLVVGKAVTETSSGGNQGNQPSENLVGYINPYSVALPEALQPQKDLQRINISPYQLTIDRIATQMEYQESRISLNFDYTLTQDLLTKIDGKNHKIVIEIADKLKKTILSKEISLPTTGESGSSGENILTIGKHTIKIDWTNEPLLDLIKTLSDYDLNVYYQVQTGYKYLIATQSFPWLVNRSLN